MDKFKVICLCGSTRYKNAFMCENKRLTLEGNIVISVGCFGHADNLKFEPGQKELLDEIHLAKIDMADEIFVINMYGYIGKSTAREIEYAEQNDKTVRYLEECDVCADARPAAPGASVCVDCLED